MHLGDGDCGTTLLAGSSGLVNAFTISPDDPSGPSDFVSDVQRLTTILGSQMGGTSGALYSIFFSGFANSVQQQLKLDPNMRLSLHVFSKALGGGLVAMRRYTSAGVGDRTMMDALIPFVEKIQQCASNQSIPAFEAALEAAKEGCEHTRHQRSRYGRSTYVGAASTVELEADSMPDPGACGIVAIVQGVLTALMDRH
jgi:dihydroxyacetone kinase